jgi:hypothetical protein
MRFNTQSEDAERCMEDVFTNYEMKKDIGYMDIDKKR